MRAPTSTPWCPRSPRCSRRTRAPSLRSQRARSRRARSRTSSGSSRTSCWCSRSSRSSWAASSSTTRSASWSPSGCASWRSCGPSARPAARSCGPCCSRPSSSGLVSSVVGIAAGFGLAVGLRAVLDAVGLDLPSGSLVLLPRTIIAGLLVGVVVTAASALLPAIAASRIPPVAAMRADEVAPRRRSMRWRAVIGTVVLLGGAFLIYGGLTNDAASSTVVLSSVGVGAVVMILGAYVLSALVARPVAAVIGAPFARFFGVSGKLAQRNAGRSPRRTSATAAAIMVGIALITLASIMSASIQATVDEVFATRCRCRRRRDGAVRRHGGFSPELAERAADLPEVAAITRVPFGPVLIDGEERFVAASGRQLRRLLHDRATSTARSSSAPASSWSTPAPRRPTDGLSATRSS